MGHWERVVANLFARLDGPLHFRFIIQPLVAATIAIIDGVRDAKAGKPAYLWTVIFVPKDRKELLQRGWKRIGKIFLLAVTLDVIYQLIVHHWIYPGETVIVAVVLAIVPYILLCGPANRVARLIVKTPQHKSKL